MIYVEFIKTIDGKDVRMNKAVYAQTRDHLPEFLSRDARWCVTEEEDLNGIPKDVTHEVAENGFAIINRPNLIAVPFNA